MEFRPLAWVASSAIRAISSSPSSTTLLIAVYRVARRIVSKSTVVHTKMGHVSKTTPLLGWFAQTWYSLPLHKWRLYRGVICAVNAVFFGCVIPDVHKWALSTLELLVRYIYISYLV